jgi:hypothetical protein
VGSTIGKVPFRLGLLVDSMTATKYVHEFAQWASSHREIEFTTCAILHAKGHTPLDGNGLLRWVATLIRKRRINDILSVALWKAIVAVESLLLRKHSRHRNHFDRYDLSPFVHEVIEVHPNVLPPDFAHCFDKEDIEKVLRLDCDLLVRCGNGTLRGEILRASRLGIISIYYANNRDFRGGPPGFWEVMHRSSMTGFTIQRLTEEPDSGEVLMRGQFATRHYYLLNQSSLYKKANHYLRLLIEKIALKGNLPAVLPNVPYSGFAFQLPNAYQASKYLTKFGCSIIKGQIEKWLGIAHRWNVAYSYCNWRDAALWRGIQLKNPPLHFLADPFVFSKNEKDYAFVEDYDFRTSRGTIAVYELSPGGGTRIGTALEENFHLSFPYIFEYGGDLYMCPDTAENRDIRLYRCVEFPLRWKFEKTLIKDVSAVDTLIFEKDKRWWLLTNIDSADDGDHCSELSIFSSESPLDDKWVPHPLNPIFVDASCARNGGLIQREGTIFRVSQGQGFGLYGERAQINQIIELTEATYRETVLCELTPTFRGGVKGTHHFSENGKITAFDFVTNSRLNS